MGHRAEGEAGEVAGEGPRVWHARWAQEAPEEDSSVVEEGDQCHQ